MKAAFSAASNIAPGLDVQIDGFDVGKVSDVTLVDGQAVVELGIDDPRFWPLRQGTTATLRWPTPGGSGNRRVDLDPAGSPGPVIPEGGIIKGEDAIAPVEIDQVLNTFDEAARKHLAGAARNGARTFGGHSRSLNRALGSSDEALSQYRDVSSDLAADRHALTNLVTASSAVAGRLVQRDRAIGDLVHVASRTMSTFAGHSTRVRDSIERFAPTLKVSTETLARVDGSVARLHGLVNDLRPGAAKLSSLARSARPVLTQLRPTARLGARVAEELRSSAPPLTETLRRATPRLGDAEAILTRAEPMLECLRPYTPEVAGVAVLFGSWTKNFTPAVTEPRLNASQSHYARVLALASSTSFHAYPAGTSSQIQELLGKRYAMPRPPGLAVGKPWFLPRCGVTEDALDPTKDPEDHR